MLQNEDMIARSRRKWRKDTFFETKKSLRQHRSKGKVRSLKRWQ